MMEREVNVLVDDELFMKVELKISDCFCRSVLVTVIIYSVYI